MGIDVPGLDVDEAQNERVLITRHGRPSALITANILGGFTGFLQTYPVYPVHPIKKFLPV